MKKFAYILSLFVFIVCIANSALAQNVVKTSEVSASKKIVDNGYYKYEITGDAKKDAENESKAKDEFVQKYPEQYEKMKSDILQNSKHAIDYKEYLNMPANKREHIDANPDKYYFINK